MCGRASELKISRLDGGEVHVKTLHQMFGPKGNPTAAKLFDVVACLQEYEGVRLQVVA